MKKFYLIFALLSLIVLTITAQPQLTWRFANAQVINAGTQLQFDVEVKASVAGSYHRDLQIYFDYSTLGFGSNIVANGKITYTPLTLMNTHYLVVNMADNTSSKFAIITEGINEMNYPDPTHLVQNYFNAVPTTFTGLLRFTITFAPSGNTQTAGIQFDQALMNGGQYYQSTTNTSPFKYLDASSYENNLKSMIRGQIVYANAGAATLNNCTVTFKSGATVIGTALTNSTGNYQYYISDGTYTLTTTRSSPWLDATSVGDVNLLIDHILGTSLTGVNFLAAEVTNDGSVDVGDINLMIDDILGVFVGYPAIPTWVFVTQSATVSNSIGIKNYSGLLAGDPDADGL